MDWAQLSRAHKKKKKKKNPILSSWCEKMGRTKQVGLAHTTYGSVSDSTWTLWADWTLVHVRSRKAMDRSLKKKKVSKLFFFFFKKRALPLARIVASGGWAGHTSFITDQVGPQFYFGPFALGCADGPFLQ